MLMVPMSLVERELVMLGLGLVGIIIAISSLEILFSLLMIRVTSTPRVVVVSSAMAEATTRAAGNRKQPIQHSDRSTQSCPKFEHNTLCYSTLLFSGVIKLRSSRLCQ